MAESVLLDRIEHQELPAPSPFLKWVGGKSKLLPQYRELFPTGWRRYHEPFVGGGAVFFGLDPGPARLSDANGRLIETYRVIRDNLAELVDELEVHRQKHSEKYYYAQRTLLNAPRGATAVERAARFIYINKTCFNGLYRENSKGGFNVPIGDKPDQSTKAPTLFDLSNLISVSRSLQGVELAVAPFDSVLTEAKPGDFVYFDPPYVPLSATSSFCNYTKDGFDDDLQIKLAQTFDRLARRGCYVMLSNSNSDFVRELYAGWRIETVYAGRSVNSRGDRRGKVKEVAVLSW